MTRKNAKKTAARARQEKTGQKYQSALRAEGPEVIKLWTKDPDTIADHSAESLAKINDGNSHIINDDGCYVVVNRHFNDKGERTDFFRPSPRIFPEALEAMRRLQPDDMEKRVNEAFLVLNNGLGFTGVNAPTREALLGRIRTALHILAGIDPKTPLQPLGKPLANPLRENRATLLEALATALDVCIDRYDGPSHLHDFRGKLPQMFTADFEVTFEGTYKSIRCKPAVDFSKPPRAEPCVRVPSLRRQMCDNRGVRTRIEEMLRMALQDFQLPRIEPEKPRPKTVRTPHMKTARLKPVHG